MRYYPENPCSRGFSASCGPLSRVATTGVASGDSVQDECDLQVDAEAGDLSIAHQHLLLLHPGALDIAQCLAGLCDRVADCRFEALAAGRGQLDGLGNAHGVSSARGLNP